MTADAKIGLLLGLVFIFIIAFIINGLPNFWSHPSTANATPQVAKSTDNPGVAGPAQDAQKKLDWQKESSAVTTPLTASGSATPTLAKDAAGSGATQVLEPPLTSASQTTLDESIQKFVNSQKAADAVASAPQPASDLMDTSVPQLKAPSPIPATPASAVTKTDKTTPASTTIGIARKETPKEYVVQEGDDLGTIAKKVYGSVGKNADLIYTYNRTTLKSKDMVTVGQKLRIPPLPAAPTTTRSNSTKPATVLPAAQFEPVSAVGDTRRVVTKAFEVSPSIKPAATSSDKSQADGRSYVVQADDNLWKIATSQLGNGARFEEIVKLNAAVLKNKDSVTPGMRLKMPAK
jgi:nucleoid-associated protein YgaU